MATKKELLEAIVGTTSGTDWDLSTTTSWKSSPTVTINETFHLENCLPYLKFLGILVDKRVTFRRVGSSCIEGIKYPNDYDLLVMSFDGITDVLKELGFVEGGSPIPESEFTSYRHRDYYNVNIIVSNTKDYYDTFWGAQDIVEQHKIVNKDDRIAVFDYMMDREGCISRDQFVNIITDKPRDEAEIAPF